MVFERDCETKGNGVKQFGGDEKESDGRFGRMTLAATEFGKGAGKMTEGRPRRGKKAETVTH